MSLILDALRKAERERELGQVPTIGSQMPLRRRPSPPARGPWIAAVVVVALALAAAVAWSTRDAWWPASEPAAAVAGSVEAPPEPAVSTVATEPTGHTAAPVADTPPPVTGPDPVEEARRVAEQALAVAEAAKREAEKAAAVATAPEPQPPPAPASTPEGAGPVQTERTTDAMPTAAGAALPPDAPGATPTPPVAESAKPAPEAPPAEPAAPPVPLVWELPLAVRQSLPKLAIAMHVYAEEPTRRFVILDDQRLVEGESGSGGIAVREIRRDGVVLEYQGQRFLLPRGGR